MSLILRQELIPIHPDTPTAIVSLAVQESGLTASICPESWTSSLRTLPNTLTALPRKRYFDSVRSNRSLLLGEWFAIYLEGGLWLDRRESTTEVLHYFFGCSIGNHLAGERRSEVQLGHRKERVKAMDDLYHLIPDYRVALKLKVLAQIRVEVGQDQPMETPAGPTGTDLPPRAQSYEEWLKQNQQAEKARQAG